MTEFLSDSRLLKSNESLDLTTIQGIWLVTSGTVSIFATPLTSVGEGCRNHLFNMSAGEVFFGIVVTGGIEEAEHESQNLAAGLSYKFMAVALTQTVLIPCALQNLKELEQRLALASSSHHHDADTPESKLSSFEHLCNHLEIWVQKLTSICPQLVAPTLLLNRHSNIDESAITAALHTLHQEFLQFYNQDQKEQEAIEQAQFQARQQLNFQVTHKAINKLRAVLWRSPEFADDPTPVLLAVGAIGRAMGVQIRPPAKSEDLSHLKDSIGAIARSNGLRLRRIVLPNQWWHHDAGPLLGYTQDQQPVALLPQGGKGYELYNPQNGSRLLLTERLAKQLTAEAYIFYQPLSDRPIYWFDLVKFALNDRSKDLWLVLLTGTLASLLGMIITQSTATLIDSAIPDSDRRLLVQVTLGLIVSALGVAFFTLIRGLTSLRLHNFAGTTASTAVWDRLLKLRVSFFRQFTAGDLRSRVSAINQIRMQIGNTILNTFLNSFFALLNLGLLFVYSVPLAWVAVGIAVVTLMITVIADMAILKPQRHLQEIEGKLFGFNIQLINSISKLRVKSAENRAFAAWAADYSQQLQQTKAIHRVKTRLLVFNTGLPLLSSICLYPLAIPLLGQPETSLTTGTFLAFNAAFGIFITGVIGLSNILGDIVQINTLWERAKPILQSPLEVNEQKVDPGHLTGHLKLDRVSFRYQPDQPLILDRITIEAKSKEFIALVGPSGSGKSTIIRLLLGFDTPEEGTIYYDHQDLSELDIIAVRRQLGVVLQQGRLMTKSIFDNIACGSAIAFDQAWEAARMAGFDEDIKSFPMGMHTLVSEGGSNLSGGQRQRLLITRALVLKPKILIFDEATSALDNYTQAIVTESLDRLNVTRIVVAHRLSTICNANRIYVIVGGRVVQQGTFDELMMQEGTFANLMARQIA